MSNDLAAAGIDIYDFFQTELYSRISILPIKSTGGKKCISINMQGCSNNFIMAADEFLQKESNYYKLLVKGEKYYIEVLNNDTFVNAKMNQLKNEKIDTVAEKAGLGKAVASKDLAATLESITEGIKAWDNAPLIVFGSFSLSPRAARTGKKTQTGEALADAVSKTAKFKAGQHLKNAVN